MSVSDRSISALLPLTLLCLFLLTICVSIGWFLLFDQVFQNVYAATIGAALLTGVAIALVRLIAEQRASKKLDDSVSYRWYYAWPAILALFLISAMGTVNAAFVTIEGAAIVRQDVILVRTAYDQLQIEAARRLRIENYEDKHERLKAKLAQLWEEIYNPNKGNYCGVGEYADRIIRDIRAIVPDMPVIRGSGVIRPCNEERAREVYNAYERSALATLAKDAEFVVGRGPERSAFLSSLERNVEKARSDLSSVEMEVGKFLGFSRPSVQGPLANAANDYASDRATYAEFLRPAATGLPEDLDITASQRLGSLAALWQIVSNRFFTANAWFYFVFAFALDVGTAWLLTQLFLVRRRMDRHAKDVDEYVLPDANPRYLWVNPFQSSKIKVRHV